VGAGRLGDLPEIMRESGHRSRAYENAMLNLVEAETLKSRVGERFEAVITEAQHDDEREGTVMIASRPSSHRRSSNEEPVKTSRIPTHSREFLPD
jgi:hypothetical protein